MLTTKGDAPFSAPHQTKDGANLWVGQYPTIPGRWLGFYENLRDSVRGTAELAVKPEQSRDGIRLIELVTHVTELPLGLYQATSNFTVSSATWGSLSQEDKEALAAAANRANADMTQRWGYDMPTEAIEAAEGAGIEFVEADASLVQAVEEFAATERETAIRLAQENFGIDDASDHVERFLGLLEKWEGIVGGLEPAEIAARVQDEVWSQVDFATYGG